MLKNISKLGTNLNKEEQKEINGGNPFAGTPCENYTGPIEVTCEEYFNLPPMYQMCVDIGNCEG